MSDSYRDRTEQSPFVEGERYRVIKPAPSWIGRLVAGELLTYVDAVYAPKQDTLYSFFRACENKKPGPFTTTNH